MADVAPWLAQDGGGAAPSGNVAPWLQDQPGVVEDVAKSIPSGLAQGVISIPGLPGDLSNLAKAGVDKLAEKTGISAPTNPWGWLTGPLDGHFPNWMKKMRDAEAAHPTHQFPTGDVPGSYEMPTSKDIQGQVEKVTGPFYEAKTPVGRAVQTAAQVAPSIATGGGPIAGTLAKAAGAGVTSELAGEGANALKPHLPDSVAPYAEPVARTIGAGAGMFAPSVVRRAVTPLPMSDARLDTVNALRQTNPELVNVSSAGQLTESPRLMAAEARSPRMADLPQRQNEAYTTGVMRQAGSDGMFDTPGLAQAAGRGGELDTLQNANQMGPSQYSLLKQYAESKSAPGSLGNPPSELYKEVGPSQAYQDMIDALNRVGHGGAPPSGMQGQRYGAMKQIMQNAGEGAPTTHEKTAIFDLRDKMKDAFHNSMPADESQHLRDLDRGYSNYMTIKDIPVDVGRNTVTPNQVFKASPRGSELETHANQANSVMTPLPKPNYEGGFGTKVLGGLLGGAVGAGSGALAHSGTLAAAEAPFLSYYGFNHLNDFVQAGKNGVGRIAARPGMQSYLGNQRWRPGPASTTDGDDLIRLLMAPKSEIAKPSQ